MAWKSLLSETRYYKTVLLQYLRESQTGCLVQRWPADDAGKKTGKLERRLGALTNVKFMGYNSRTGESPLQGDIGWWNSSIVHHNLEALSNWIRHEPGELAGSNSCRCSSHLASAECDAKYGSCCWEFCPILKIPYEIKDSLDLPSFFSGYLIDGASSDTSSWNYMGEQYSRYQLYND